MIHRSINDISAKTRNKQTQKTKIDSYKKARIFFIDFVLKFTFEYKAIIHSLFLIVNKIYKKIYILVKK